jgi:hypothetical protein
MQTMMQGIEIKKPSVGDIKALLSLNFRIAVYVKAVQVGAKETPGVGEEIEYHFVRDKQNDENPLAVGLEMQVNCVLCKSKIGDSLKLCGMAKPFTEIVPLFEVARLTGNYALYFERTRVSVFPFNWYPCFEKEDPKDPRWKEIEDTIPMLPSITLDLMNMEEMQKKQKRDKETAAKREQEEQEKKKREDENKKREESRRKMEELAKALEKTARADENPENFVKFMEDAMKNKK